MILKLFLSHFHGDAKEVVELATELRLRGVVPWVDKDGGFSVGDDSEQEARRAIREDCFGLLLYATEEALKRDFIRDVEIDEAKKVKAYNPEFDLFAVPRNITFEVLKKNSLSQFGIDLTKFHGIPVRDGRVAEGRRRVADAVLSKVLNRAVRSDRDSISIQLSTRRVFPDEPQDVLLISAIPLLASDPSSRRSWERLLLGMRSVCTQIVRYYGAPRIRVHGSKHLTTAFMFGRVFSRFALDIRQTGSDVWRSDVPVHSGARPFARYVQPASGGDSRLFVEVASRQKNVPAAVQRYIDESGVTPSVRLQLKPPDEPLDADERLCREMAVQTYNELEFLCAQHQVDEIHLFVAAPQAYMMMLGQLFSGMPPVQLYERHNERYVRSALIPSGVL